MWRQCVSSPLLSAALLFPLPSSLPIHQPDAHHSDISLKVIGIESQLLISPITVTSGRLLPRKDSCAAAAVCFRHNSRPAKNTPFTHTVFLNVVLYFGPLCMQRYL